VIQADGGTRTASITGAYVALALALEKLRERDLIRTIPLWVMLLGRPHGLPLDSGSGYTGVDRTVGRGRYLGTLDMGMRHQWEFSRRNRISNDASLKTDVDRTSDWRVSHVAALQAALNAMLALKLSHEINYRNEPVPGFTRADTVAAAAIVATF